MRTSYARKFKIIMLLCLAMMTIFSASVYAETEKIVTVGYFSEPGMMNGARDGALKSGYAYEYLQELASHAGWKYRYVYGSFSELYQKLAAGEIDMLPFLVKTAKRQGEVLFLTSRWAAVIIISARSDRGS